MSGIHEIEVRTSDDGVRHIFIGGLELNGHEREILGKLLSSPSVRDLQKRDVWSSRKRTIELGLKFAALPAITFTAVDEIVAELWSEKSSKLAIAIFQHMTGLDEWYDL